VLDPIEIALETDAERVGLLFPRPGSRADGPSRARGQGRVELGLPFLAPANTPTDEVPSLVGFAYDRLVDLHGTSVTVR
jgi:hypothetical protein